MKILIVEDELRLAYLVQNALKRVDMQSDVFPAIQAAEAALDTCCYDTIILDLTLPDGQGRDFLARYRRAGGTIPLLILTAEGGIDSKIDCLNLGADDYVVKPFDMGELIARVRALLRRPGGALGVNLIAGNVEFDTVGRHVTANAASMDLSRRELVVLEHLMRRVGRVVPKEVLEQKLYDAAQIPESNPIPVHIHNLREKLSDKDASIEIHTIRGVGYILKERK